MAEGDTVEEDMAEEATAEEVDMAEEGDMAEAVTIIYFSNYLIILRTFLIMHQILVISFLDYM